MDWSFRQNWDEYTWAKEIRKDELRISGYFRTLPRCLDLPGEEEMIFKKLMSQPELVPTGVSDPQRQLRSEWEGEDDDADWNEDEVKRNRNSNELSRRVENLAVEWNVTAVSQFQQASLSDVMTVTCAFGKLLSRIYNFESTDEADDTMALRIALLKRILMDLNELLQCLEQFGQELTSNGSGSCGEFFGPLTLVRESVIDRLGALR